MISVPKPVVPLGIVGLDKRTADGAIASAHHQKMMAIRSPAIDVAFCGGVDLPFTSRDAVTDPPNFTAETILNGDWRSGSRGFRASLRSPLGLAGRPTVRQCIAAWPGAAGGAALVGAKAVGHSDLDG
jgi:hypothetical protein